MKKILFALLLFSSLASRAQDEIMNPFFEIDTILNENQYVTYWIKIVPPYAYRKVIIQHDTSYIKLDYEDIFLPGLKNTRNDGAQVNFLSTNSEGKVLSVPKDSLFIFKSQVVDFPVLFSGAYNDLTGNPTLFSGAYSDLTGKPTLFSGAYSDLTGKPALFSGSYTDLSNKPSIPSAQVNSDWTASSGVAEILHKPTLFSGVYSDLSGKPSLFSGAYSDLTGKPSLFSGSYTDLTSKPTIPTNTNQLTNGSGFVTTNNVYAAGFGITKSGSEPSATFSINTSDIMTVSMANDSIAVIETKVNGKVPQSRTLSINGTSFDLSANRTWTGVGIEIPSQTGNSGKLLTTNGTALSWVTASGETNTASNVGTGAGVFKQKSTLDLQFKSILGTTNQVVVTGNTNDITISLATRIMSSATRSLVSATNATGFQVSSTRDYSVNYSVFAQVSSALLGTNTVDVYLEIAATNSTTPADWTTISRSGLSKSGVVSTDGNTQTVGGFIPAGYYVRIRTSASGANSGSASFSYQVGQENTY